MSQSLQLLHKALEQNPNKAFWCEQLQLKRNALAQAQSRERLSPTIAGNLARLLGEDVSFWISVAALEAEPDSYGKRKLQSLQDGWRKRSQPNRQKTTKMRKRRKMAGGRKTP